MCSFLFFFQIFRCWWNGIHDWFKINCLRLKRSSRLRRIFFLMEFFNFFDTLFSFNIVIEVIALYILFSLGYGVLYSSSLELATPPLLNSFLSFSLFFLILTFIFFGFDISMFSLDYNLYSFNQNIQLIFLFISIMVLFVTRDFVGARFISKFEYDILFSFVLLSAVCLCFADDFLLIYLAIELQSLCFYVFATFNRNSEFSTESGLKYFVFGAVISCLLLVGFSLIYLSFGSTSFESLLCLTNASDNPFLFCGMVFILIAFLFKVGAAPFHSWLCDVYDGAMISVTLLFAAVPKIIIFSVIVKIFLLIFYDFASFWSSFFLFSSLLSIAVGSLSAIYQKRLKRLFAYSTVAHTGFILLGVVAASSDSVKTLIFYLMIYSVLTIILFSLLIFAIISIVRFPGYLASWTSSGLKNYVFVMSFALTLFSIAGIPPLAGFFSKFLILFSFISQEYLLTSVTIVLISSVACFYYIRLIKTFFFVKSSKNSFWVSSTKRQHSEYIIGTLLFFNMFFVFRPELFSSFSTLISITLL